MGHCKIAKTLTKHGNVKNNKYNNEITKYLKVFVQRKLMSGL